MHAVRVTAQNCELMFHFLSLETIEKYTTETKDYIKSATKPQPTVRQVARRWDKRQVQQSREALEPPSSVLVPNIRYLKTIALRHVRQDLRKAYQKFDESLKPVIAHF